MEFTPKKPVVTGVRNNPFASDGKAFLKRYSRKVDGSTLYGTPLHQKPRSQKFPSRSEQILAKSDALRQSEKENESSDLQAKTRKPTQATLTSYKRPLGSSNSENTDDSGCFDVGDSAKKVRVVPPMKCYSNKRKPLNFVRSRLLADISPEKVERAYGAKVCTENAWKEENTGTSPQKDAGSGNPLVAKVERNLNIKFEAIAEKENVPVKAGIQVQSKLEPHLIGFPNYGNTCYLNAVIQSLLGLEPFAVDTSHIMSKLNVCQTSITYSLWNVIVSRQKANLAAINRNLRAFKENVEKVDRSFSGFKMQDANEFLTKVLDTTKDEIDRSHVTTPSPDRPASRQVSPCAANRMCPSPIPGSTDEADSSIFSTPSQDSNVDLTERSLYLDKNDSLMIQPPRGKVDVSEQLNTLNDHMARDLVLNGTTNDVFTLLTPKKNVLLEERWRNPIKENFGFQLLESYRCMGCGSVEGRRQEHFALYVDLPIDPHQSSIQHAVEAYMGHDERELRCEKCGHTKTSVVTTFTKLPRVLIVQMKRYEYKPELYECVKVSSRVKVNRCLNVERLVSDDAEEPEQWTPRPVCTSSVREGRPSTLTVRNLSSELNICSPDPVQEGLGPPPPPEEELADAEVERERTEMEDVVQKSEDDENPPSSQREATGDEDDDFQKAIRLSLQEMGMSYMDDESANWLENSEEDIADPPVEVGDHCYQLVSLISHFGLTTCTGHYVADVYNGKEKRWFHYDDETVNGIQETSVLGEGRQKNGYIFFYVHKELFSQFGKCF